MMGDYITPEPSDCSPAAEALTTNPFDHHDGNTATDEKIKSTANGPLFAPANYETPAHKLIDRYVDDYRPLRVAVIGAGLAGVLAGALLPAKVPNIKLTIFEKNADVGGTWFENRYPGVRCDVPAHVYQSSFEQNTQWSEHFAQGPEIRQYWQDVAKKYGVYDFLKLSQRVDKLQWSSAAKEWNITVTDLTTGQTKIEAADFVLSATGRFNAWKLPNYPGMSDFKGLLRHASNWDTTFNPESKRVAVIGNGASGIQLTSHLQRTAGRVDHYARNKTWISASFTGDDTSLDPLPISEEKRQQFKGDPEAYVNFRKDLEQKYYRGFYGWTKGHQSLEASREAYVKHMSSGLSKRPDLIDSFIPDFSPSCRRLTPGPGYLEAVTSDNVEYVQTRIKRFTATGIETEDGIHREVDAIFCATGANVDMIPAFPIIGEEGDDLRQVWSEHGKYGFPYNYIGAATPGFPNLLYVHGVNGSGRSGTVPHSVETQITFYARILRKAAREGIAALQPRRRATDQFVEWSDAFFATTVLSENCSSWYNGGKPGARIHGLFPGSATLVSRLHREPRWEDWDYEYLEETRDNPFLWYFGRGCSRQELDPEADVTSYLQQPGKVDIRDVHEGWHSFP